MKFSYKNCFKVTLLLVIVPHVLTLERLLVSSQSNSFTMIKKNVPRGDGKSGIQSAQAQAHNCPYCHCTGPTVLKTRVETKGQVICPTVCSLQTYFGSHLFMLKDIAIFFFF